MKRGFTCANIIFHDQRGRRFLLFQKKWSVSFVNLIPKKRNFWWGEIGTFRVLGFTPINTSLIFLLLYTHFVLVNKNSQRTMRDVKRKLLPATTDLPSLWWGGGFLNRRTTKWKIRWPQRYRKLLPWVATGEPYWSETFSKIIELLKMAPLVRSGLDECQTAC